MEKLSEEDDREIYENSYYSFIRKLEELAASPQEACNLLTHFNVSAEIKFGLEGSDYLFNYASCNFSQDQREALLDLIESFKCIPLSVVEYTEVASVSLRNMDHPCWIPLRKKAQNLLSLLKSNTEQNQMYFL
ncbi:hypothetical protein ACFQ2T_06495 [Methylophilus flavus]|uniref:Uncharacterized protein n=1 Tax=Methylophilus flavus TaxID=640084 RepID=A0ABW3PIS6_9PROT